MSNWSGDRFDPGSIYVEASLRKLLTHRSVIRMYRLAGRNQTGRVAVQIMEDLVMSMKRELIEPRPGDKRYVRRDEQGQFTKDQHDVGRSLMTDRRTHAKTVAPKGQGDHGDQKRS